METKTLTKNDSKSGNIKELNFKAKYIDINIKEGLTSLVLIKANGISKTKTLYEGYKCQGKNISNFVNIEFISDNAKIDYQIY